MVNILSLVLIFRECSYLTTLSPWVVKEPHWRNDLRSGSPGTVAISANGEYIVAGYTGVALANEVLFFNNSYHSGIDKLPEWNYSTGDRVNAVAISAKGEYVVAGTTDQNPGNELFVFNKSADDGEPEWSYDYGEIRYILSVAISADGEYIATGEEGPAFWDGKVSLFSNSKSQREWTSFLEGKANTVDITEDGQYIVAGTDYEQNDGSWNESTIFLYNKTANPIGNALPEWAFNTSDDVNSVSVSSWGNYIGAGGAYAGGTGIAYLFYHARPIPPPLGLPRPEDDDDDDEAEAIPFGNYYLLFAVLAIAALIIIYKRKVILSKR